MIAEIIRNNTSNGKAHLVGMSIGAQIIIQLLSKAPELVDHAIIGGTNIQKISHAESLLELLDYTIKVYEPVKNTDFFIKPICELITCLKIILTNLKNHLILIKNDSLNRILKENIFFKMPDGLEKIEVPVLVMVGEKDYTIIKESARSLLMSFPISEGYIAPNVGHAWNFEDPELFNRVFKKMDN